MKVYKLAETERKFAEIIWDNEPISSGDLVKLSEKALGWKKSTTYTVLKKLCERGLFNNERAEVTSIIKREEYSILRSEQLIGEDFGGSVPRFLSAFINSKRLSKDQIKELKNMIDSYEGD